MCRLLSDLSERRVALTPERLGVCSLYRWTEEAASWSQSRPQFPACAQRPPPLDAGSRLSRKLEAKPLPPPSHRTSLPCDPRGQWPGMPALPGGTCTWPSGCGNSSLWGRTDAPRLPLGHRGPPW